MFRARRETWAAFAALVAIGCGGEWTALAPTTPVTPRSTIAPSTVPAKQ